MRHMGNATLSCRIYINNYHNGVFYFKVFYYENLQIQIYATGRFEMLSSDLVRFEFALFWLIWSIADLDFVMQLEKCNTSEMADDTVESSPREPDWRTLQQSRCIHNIKVGLQVLPFLKMKVNISK